MESEVPGAGRSTPVVWDKYVFVQTAVPVARNAQADTPGADGDAPNPVRHGCG